MNSKLTVGLTGEARYRVVTQHLVSAVNPAGPAVLASPWLLSFLEHAAYNALAPHLEKGQQSVGVGFDFEHLAPTPAGHVVIARARVTAVEGPRVTLDIEAHDEAEPIARGTHVRAVIDMHRFERRRQRKARE